MLSIITNYGSRGCTNHLPKQFLKSQDRSKNADEKLREEEADSKTRNRSQERDGANDETKNGNYKESSWKVENGTT